MIYAAKERTIFEITKLWTFFIVYLSFFRGGGAVTLHVGNIPKYNKRALRLQ